MGGVRTGPRGWGGCAGLPAGGGAGAGEARQKKKTGCPRAARARSACPFGLMPRNCRTPSVPTRGSGRQSEGRIARQGNWNVCGLRFRFSLASGLRSECCNPPRQVLAGPDGKPPSSGSPETQPLFPPCVPGGPSNGFRARGGGGVLGIAAGIGRARYAAFQGCEGAPPFSALCGTPGTARRNSIQTTLRLSPERSPAKGFVRTRNVCSSS